jgi:hypothetical protein
LLFDTRSGALQQVRVEAAGEEKITVGGRVLWALRYVVSGDLARDLVRPGWDLAAIPAHYRGAAITLTIGSAHGVTAGD